MDSKITLKVSPNVPIRVYKREKQVLPLNTEKETNP
jgi:hypothetical protein